MATTLTAGDIAIIGFNFDNNDEFSFVLLRDIESGTAINFTDKGWLSTNTFRSGEGTYTWTASSNLTAGTVLKITSTDLTGSNVSLDSAGDQITAYQVQGSSNVLLYAVNSEGTGWQSTASDANTSALTRTT